MSNQRGRNGGVTGLVDIQGTPAFTLKVGRFQQQEGAAALVRTKRGDDRRRIKQTTPGGQLLCWGAVRGDGYPLPNNLKGCSGSITLTYSGAKKSTLQVKVLDATLSYTDADEDQWKVALICEVTANPALAGFGGDQFAVNPNPALSTVETHEGIAKGVDPDGIADLDTFRLDVEGIGDTSIDEVNWITAQIATFVATRAGMKLRRLDFTRTDTWGGSMLVTCARTTTGEDAVNEASSKTIDPKNLASTAATAAINNPTPPTPTGASFVSRGTTTKELNDGTILYTTTWGLTSTQGDAENEKIRTVDDANNIADEAVRAQVWATAGAAPALPTDAPANNVKLVGVTDVPLNPEEKLRVWLYGPKDSRDELILPNYATTADANGFEGAAIRAYLDGDTPPAAPAGLVYRTTRTTPVTLGLGVNRTLAVDVYGVRSTKDDVEMPRTRYETDLAALEQTVSIGVAFATGGSPTAPTTPAGLVPLDYFDVPETAAKSVRVYRFAFVNGATRLTNAQARRGVDPNALDSEERKADVWDTLLAEPGAPSVPAGLKLVFKEYVPVISHPTKQVRVFRYGRNDSVDRLVLPETWTLADPSNVASRGRVAAFNATPSVPSGYKSRGLVGRYQTGTDLLNVVEFGLTSEADDVVYGFTRSDGDPERGNTHVYGSLAACLATDTVAMIEAAQFAVLKSSLNFAGVRVRKLHDTLAVVEITAKDSITVIEFESQASGARLVPAYWDGTDVRVYLRRKWKRTTGKWLAEVVPQYRHGATLAIRIHKRVTTSGGINMQWALAGTSNNAAFLGLAAGTVTYVGAAGGVNWTDLPPMDIGYELYADSLGIVELADYSPGMIETATNLTSVTERSWVKASDLGMSCALATPAGYGGLL